MTRLAKHEGPKKCRHCGFRDFGDPGAQFRLNRWLYALDRPGVLFDRATTWLIAQKVLLAGRSSPLREGDNIIASSKLRHGFVTFFI
jgi:hypothetical protein